MIAVVSVHGWLNSVHMGGRITYIINLYAGCSTDTEDKVRL